MVSRPICDSEEADNSPDATRRTRMRSCSLAKDFDARTVPRNFRESRVPRDQWSIECFGESNISRIVRGQITSQRPDPTEENIMWVAIQREIREVFKRLLAPLHAHFPGQRIATQDLGNFKVEQVWGMQCICVAKQSLRHFSRCRCVQQNFNKR
jgi:hypothetical protein